MHFTVLFNGIEGRADALFVPTMCMCVYIHFQGNIRPTTIVPFDHPLCVGASFVHFTLLISGQKERTGTLIVPSAPPLCVGGHFVHFTLPVSGKKERSDTHCASRPPPLAGGGILSILHCQSMARRNDRHTHCAFRPPLVRGSEFCLFYTASMAGKNEPTHSLGQPLPPFAWVGILCF